MIICLSITLFFFFVQKNQPPTPITDAWLVELEGDAFGTGRDEFIALLRGCRLRPARPGFFMGKNGGNLELNIAKLGSRLTRRPCKGDDFEILIFEAKIQNAGICRSRQKCLQHGHSFRLAGVWLKSENLRFACAVTRFCSSRVKK